MDTKLLYLSQVRGEIEQATSRIERYGEESAQDFDKEIGQRRKFCLSSASAASRLYRFTELLELFSNFFKLASALRCYAQEVAAFFRLKIAGLASTHKHAALLNGIDFGRACSLMFVLWNES